MVGNSTRHAGEQAKLARLAVHLDTAEWHVRRTIELARTAEAAVHNASPHIERQANAARVTLEVLTKYKAAMRWQHNDQAPAPAGSDVDEAEESIAIHAAQAHACLAAALDESKAFAQECGVLEDDAGTVPEPMVSAATDLDYGPRLRLRLAPSRRGGVGVFTDETVDAGQIIERCPLLLFPGNPAEALNYYIRMDTAHFPKALPLGFGAIYNHSPTPNTTWSRTEQAMVVTAIERITTGEEILISYGPTWFQSRRQVEL